MINTSILRAACGILALIVAPSAALAQSEPYGQPIGGWTFNQTPEDGGIKCRAIFGKGNQTIVMGGSNNRSNYYISLSAGKIRKGQYPGSTMTLTDGERDVTVTSNGERMWFQLEDFDIQKAADEGGFVLNIALANGDFGGGEYTLNKAAPKALNQMFECVQANTQ